MRIQNVNRILEKEFHKLTHAEEQVVAARLTTCLLTEFAKQDKGGIYGWTQYQMGYNSNRIEGSMLSEVHTVALFETGMVYADGESFKAKDIEEMNGHFLMFNDMLANYSQVLSEEIIKRYHLKLKSGVFEDAANGYIAGEYKKRANRVGTIQTTSPEQVREKMQLLLAEYEGGKPNILNLADLHFKYEHIHPFQDGNGRTGRIMLFKECLRHKIMPFIIQDKNKAQYYNTLNSNDAKELAAYFHTEQTAYYKRVKEFLFVHESLDGGD